MSCKFIYKSGERAGYITKSFLFRLLRIVCRLRQMPQLINALPLEQQLSNKQDISVGLLSVFCVTERKCLNIQSLLDRTRSTCLVVSSDVF